MSTVVTIPHGYLTDGILRHEVCLRELRGEDIVFLSDECHGLIPAQWTTEVLMRCVTRLGPGRPTYAEVRSLTLGDREALLLHLRRLTWGEHLRCVLTCPLPGCHEKLDLDLRVGDLLVHPYDDVVELYERRLVGADGHTALVRFRLPTGSDQEISSVLAVSDASAAVDVMLEKCVESVVFSDGRALPKLSSELVDQLSVCMAECDTQAEIKLEVTCTACEGTFTALFNSADFILQELQEESRILYREIHQLAHHYHWSPKDILEMSTKRRRRFLKQLEEEFMPEPIP